MMMMMLLRVRRKSTRSPRLGALSLSSAAWDVGLVWTANFGSSLKKTAEAESCCWGCSESDLAGLALLV
jgi:hypothetical protein